MLSRARTLRGIVYPDQEGGEGMCAEADCCAPPGTGN
jgi:hypothetical protein